MKPAFGGFGTTTAQAQVSPFSFNSQPAAQPVASSIFGQAQSQSPLGAAKPFGSGF